MARKIAYWTSTVIVAVMLLFALSYLTGNPQVVSGFAKAGYPPHLCRANPPRAVRTAAESSRCSRVPKAVCAAGRWGLGAGHR